jgi:hypothetical protein
LRRPRQRWPRGTSDEGRCVRWRRAVAAIIPVPSRLRSIRPKPATTSLAASVDPTDARNDILDCFGLSDRSALRQSEGNPTFSSPTRASGCQKGGPRRPAGQPRVPVFRFETFQGRPSLRYATARVMKADCTGCPNEDPNSTRRDWRVGDVGGVLEIIRPLDHDIARMYQGLRGTFLRNGPGLRRPPRPLGARPGGAVPASGLIYRPAHRRGKVV